MNDGFASALFPDNRFTIKGVATPTGLRVNIPASADTCNVQSTAVCGSTALLNQLDGFSVNPRIRVCFSGPIDLNSVPGSVSIIPVSGSSVAGGGRPIGLNQVIFDGETNCLFGKPGSILAQRTQYLLTVRNTIKARADNNNGQPVVRSSDFSQCLAGPACAQIAPLIGNDSSVVAAALFTTMSVTTWLEGAYKYVDQNVTGLALPAGFPWVFPLSTLSSITWNPDHAAPPMAAQDLPISPALKDVGAIAFGLFYSPNYLNVSGPAAGSITTTPDSPVPVPTGLPGITPSSVPVSFHVFLPKSAPPPGGYPVVIYGHGLADSQFGAPTYIASTLASRGYATVAMEVQGHGYGPKSTVTLRDKLGLTYTVSTPGRGIQLPGSNYIGPTDGCILPGPLAIRDCGRQAAVDLFALLKTIERSNGLLLGLNPNNISYIGQSFGTIYGTLFQAVAPEVKNSVLSGGGGPFADIARLSINGRSLAAALLCSLKLLNVEGPSACPTGYSGAGAPSQAYYHDSFNDNYVFRDQPPVDNSVPGAIEIQAAFESAEWMGMLGDALSFAPHLKLDPLQGNGVKNMLLEIGVGDLEVPNPTSSALAHAAGVEQTSVVFQFPVSLAPLSAITSPPPNLAYAFAALADPANPYPLPILPHRILSNPTIFTPLPANQAENIVAIAEQQTAAGYFDSNGKNFPDANSYLTGVFSGTQLFTPLSQLPPGQNFVQFQP